MYIDIRNFKPDVICSTVVYMPHKHLSLYFYWNSKYNKFIVFKGAINPTNLQNDIKGLQHISIVRQRTGYGYKHFFKCPYCGSRRQNLYFVESEYKFACRKCVDSNVYKARTSLYDGNIERVIQYKVSKIYKQLEAKSSRADMINFTIPDKPKYMRWDKYSIHAKKLLFLKYIYWKHVCGRVGDITPGELNDMLNEDNVNFAYENIIYPLTIEPKIKGALS